MKKYCEYYLAVGPYDNWKVAFSKGCVWGLPKKRVSTWRSLNSGDIVFFYVESPTSAVTGYGSVVDTLYDESPFFLTTTGRNLCGRIDLGLTSYGLKSIRSMKSVLVLPISLWASPSTAVSKPLDC